MESNIRLYPWRQFFHSLLFWQAIWFLFFQQELSAAEALLLAAIYDLATTALEAPSGHLSDRIGRRPTLMLASLSAAIGCLSLAFGGAFWVFAAGQICLGASTAFSSGTDTSLLYESLKRAGRADTIERCELRAWRFTFTALALSAILGGWLAANAPVWTFLASAASAAVALAIASRFREPPHAEDDAPSAQRAGAALDAFRNPTLLWLFALSVSMYVLSHVPFVFGQPFILEALGQAGLAQQAPPVSGAVSAAMMLISVGASWLAAPLRRRLGVGALLLLALSMQIGLIGALALSNHPLAIALLLLRMVPDSLSRPFILARIHPQLGDRRRATYLSIQSLAGRLILASTLIASAAQATAAAPLSYAEIQVVLYWYLAGGLAVLSVLVATLRRRALQG